MPQARKKPVKVARKPSRLAHHLKETGFLLSILVAFYLVACLFTYDPNDPGPFNTTNSDQVQNIGRILGAWIANFFLFLTGYIAYLLPIITVYGGWRLWDDDAKGSENTVIEVVAVITGLALFLLSSTGLSDMHLLPSAGSMPAGGGGVIGAVVASPMLELTGMLGTTLFLLSMMLVGITLFTGLSWFYVMDVTGGITLRFMDWLVANIANMRDWFAGRRARARRDEVRKTDIVRQKGKKAPKIEPQISMPQQQSSKRVVKEKQRPLFKDMPADSLPPLDMLDEPHDQPPGYSEEALKALSKQVELKLADFGVTVDVVEVHPGPVITRFELQPAPGVKSSQITNLAKDLARGLSIVSVRVVEVIPGKSTIGLEIPNENRHMVFLSEILRSEVYDNSTSPLTLALGKSISGRPIVADLAKMPHLLVAGTTGSGKSVALNAMILSLLYKTGPENVRLVMIDPKMLELSVYEGIPHLLCPVVTDMSELVPLITGMRFDQADAEITRLQDSIRSVFFIDKLELKDSPAMTATEVMVRYERMQRQFAPTLGRLQADLLDPLIEITYRTLGRAGQLPPPPEGLEAEDLDIEYTGPIPRAQKNEQAQAVSMWVNEIAALGQIVPEFTDIIDTDMVARELGYDRGVPAKLMRSEEEVQALRQQRAEAQAQAEQMAMLEQAGKSMKTIGEGTAAMEEQETMQ